MCLTRVEVEWLWTNNLTPTNKTSHSSYTIHKPTRATRTPIMSARRQWIDEAFEEAMDAIKCGNKTLRQAGRLWSVPLNSLFNSLNGKT
jgi:hypothetical protein